MSTWLIVLKNVNYELLFKIHACVDLFRTKVLVFRPLLKASGDKFLTTFLQTFSNQKCFKGRSLEHNNICPRTKETNVQNYTGDGNTWLTTRTKSSNTIKCGPNFEDIITGACNCVYCNTNF